MVEGRSPSRQGMQQANGAQPAAAPARTTRQHPAATAPAPVAPVFLIAGSSHSYQRALHCLADLRTSSEEMRAHWFRPYLRAHARGRLSVGEAGRERRRAGCGVRAHYECWLHG